MEKFKNLVHTFAYVTTGSTIGATIFLSVFNETASADGNVLWQILVISFVCSLGNLLYPSGKLNKRQIQILSCVHYTYVNFIVIGGGIYFKWFKVEEFTMVMFMWGLVSVVFAIILFISHNQVKKESENINRKIQEFRNRDNKM